MSQHGKMVIAESWMSVNQIAEHLGVASITIYRWVEQARIPAHRIGRLWKFKPSEVDAWVMSGGSNDIKRSSKGVPQ